MEEIRGNAADENVDQVIETLFKKLETFEGFQRTDEKKLSLYETFQKSIVNWIGGHSVDLEKKDIDDLKKIRGLFSRSLNPNYMNFRMTLLEMLADPIFVVRIKAHPSILGDKIDDWIAAKVEREEIAQMARDVLAKDPRAFTYNLDKFVAAGLDRGEVPEMAKDVLAKDPRAFAVDRDKFVDAGGGWGEVA